MLVQRILNLEGLFCFEFCIEFRGKIYWVPKDLKIITCISGILKNNVLVPGYSVMTDCDWIKMFRCYVLPNEFLGDFFVGPGCGQWGKPLSDTWQHLKVEGTV